VRKLLTLLRPVRDREQTPIHATTPRHGGSDSGFITMASDTKIAHVSTATNLTYATPDGGAILPADLVANLAATPIVMTDSHPTAIITALDFETAAVEPEGELSDGL
jgi:hypothetical protein